MISSVTPKLSSMLSERSQPGVTARGTIGCLRSSKVSPMTIRSTLALTKS